MAGTPQQRMLLTGAHGQLGRALTAALAERGVDCDGRDIDTLDIGDADAVRTWIVNSGAAIVINAAAYTAVDACESDEDQAMAINGDAVGSVAAACNEIDARLIHISTDYVFSGDAAHPYREEDEVAPGSAYGRTKLRGEQLARTAHHHLIVRTAWLYGHGSRNFVEAIRTQLNGNSTHLKVVADQHGCPTFCDDLAVAILDLAAAGSSGTIHAVNSGHTTWHGFAVEIARLAGADIPICPVTTSEFPRPAPRPSYSVLAIDRLEEALERKMPPWQDGLRRYMEKSCES